MSMCPDLGFCDDDEEFSDGLHDHGDDTGEPEIISPPVNFQHPIQPSPGLSIGGPPLPQAPIAQGTAVVLKLREEKHISKKQKKRSVSKTEPVNKPLQQACSSNYSSLQSLMIQLHKGNILLQERIAQIEHKQQHVDHTILQWTEEYNRMGSRLAALESVPADKRHVATTKEAYELIVRALETAKKALGHETPAAPNTM